MEPEFPLEFLVFGTPASVQTSRASTKQAWKSKVRQAASHLLPEHHFATRSRIAVTLYYFPQGRMQGDLDNIIEPILDALCQHIYVDDVQVERILAQRFERQYPYEFPSPSEILEQAGTADQPALYIRVSTDSIEEWR